MTGAALQKDENYVAGVGRERGLFGSQRICCGGVPAPNAEFASQQMLRSATDQDQSPSRVRKPRRVLSIDIHELLQIEKLRQSLDRAAARAGGRADKLAGILSGMCPRALVLVKRIEHFKRLLPLLVGMARGRARDARPDRSMPRDHRPDSFTRRPANSCA